MPSTTRPTTLRPARALGALLLLAATFAIPAGGDSTKPPADPATALSARNIGPALGGRVSRVAGLPGDPRVYFAALAQGGVWRSTDGGFQWSSVFDDQPVASMGAIAIAPSDRNVVYAGAGEANIRGNVKAGNGIYKSTDGGATWTHVWKQTGQIGTIVVDPRDANVAFAAVLGSAFGPNPERGVYKTSDGGATWRRVLYRDADTGASDVALDPTNSRVVFAGLWQTRRRPWEMTSGGPGSGLFVSRDAGETWKELSAGGLPPKIWGKVGVAVAPSDGRRVYALIEAEEGGLFRSEDGGESWELATASRGLRQRAWYYSTITVDPTNSDVAWFPQVPLFKTIDGGRTIQNVEGGGWDYHDLWIDPADPRRMIAASDAGVSLTLDGGVTWRRPPLPWAQHYHVSVDRGDPYRVYASAQDNSSFSAPSDSGNGNGISGADWHWIGGGEAGRPAPDPSDPSIVWAGEYMGYLSRYDHQSRQARNVSIYPENLSGHAPADAKVRFQWTAPILVSPHDPRTVYHAANIVFRTRDAGATWTAVSPDLTRDDTTKQQWSGGPITGDNTGVETYGTVFALTESPLEAGLLWAGSDDGLVHVSRDGGANWQNVTRSLGALREWSTIASIEASPHAAGTVYVVAHAYRLDDPRPYLWKTTDHGRTWKSITAGLDPGTHLHVVREDPARRDLLYLGTEKGMQISWDGGGTWRTFDPGIPTVAVQGLAVAGGVDRAGGAGADLVIGTMGRSVWILDDLTAVREWRPELATSDLHLFTTRPARRMREGYTADSGVGTFSNPPRGAILHYWLARDLDPKEDPVPGSMPDTDAVRDDEAATGKAKPEHLTIEIADASGRVVRRLSSTPAPPRLQAGDPDRWPGSSDPEGLPTGAGLHRIVWDLRWDGADLIPGARLDWGDPSTGPLALPGTYTVRARTHLGTEAKTTVVVEQDPRVREVAPTDLEAQLALSLEVRDAISSLTRSVTRLRSVRAQLDGRANRLEDPLHQRAGTERLIELARGLSARLSALERRYHNPDAEVSYDILARRGGAQLYSRLSPLFSFSDEGDGAPTQGVREAFAAQKALLAELDAELATLLGSELDAVEEEARRIGLGWVAR